MCGSGASVDVVDFNGGLVGLPVLAKIPQSHSFKPHNWFGGMVTDDCLRMKDAYTQEQIRLIVLFDHVQNCHEDGCCPHFGAMCQHGKILLKHMKKCAAPANSMWKNPKSRAKCSNPNCMMVKGIRAHFERCTFQGCDVCPRAHQLIRELRRKKRPRTDVTEVKSDDERRHKRCLTESKWKAEDS